MYSTTKIEYQKQSAPTGGAFKNFGSDAAKQGTTKYEPTAISGGSCGGVNLTVNFVLHGLALVFTEVAAIMNLAYTTTPDFPESWCWVMAVGSALAVLFLFIYYGIVKNAMAVAFAGTASYGLYLAVFVSTLKLSYYEEINGGVGLFGQAKAWTLLALYTQCFSVASLVTSPIAGLFVESRKEEPATPAV